ncbi:hypothetical protein H6H02_24570 [Coleofasciculus sp. FACHB-1120]|nr:hypothetical protein [Coleofasciculus sp. FACHB-1120]
MQGADFTNAILKDAKFTHAKAGLQQYWAITLLIGSTRRSPSVVIACCQNSNNF